MELRQLRYFVAIVDHGSLSRAALNLHVAQPALTQQLRQLEEELGVQLLHRSAQGVLSTDAGKIFYEHAQAIIKQVADARSAVAQSAERPSGAVTLGLPHSISGALALPLLTATRAQYPEITLQLTEELTGNLSEQLKSGRVNLAVLFDDGQLAQFATTPLVEEELRFICRADAIYAQGEQALTMTQTLKTTLILPGLQHGVRPRIESVARGRTDVGQRHRDQFHRHPQVRDPGRHWRHHPAIGACPGRTGARGDALPPHPQPVDFAHGGVVRLQEYSADQCGGGGQPAGAASQRAIVRRRHLAGRDRHRLTDRLSTSPKPSLFLIPPSAIRISVYVN